MIFTPENIYYEFNRKTYWTRIYVRSEGGKESTVLVCASRNFLSDHFKLHGEIEESHKKEWLMEVIRDLEKVGEKLLETPVYLKVYATTSEGIANGMDFLKKEVTP